MTAIRGYTLIELLVALVVGSITVAAAMASYTIISNQYNRLSTGLRLQQQGTFALELMRQDLLLANYMDPNSNQGVIANNGYIQLLDNDNAAINNSDGFDVIYDASVATRICVRFNVDAQGQLQRSQVNWAAAGCNFTVAGGAVTEPVINNVLGLQVEVINNSSGTPTLVDIFLVLESSAYQTNQVNQNQFTIPLAYEPGGDQWGANENLAASNNTRRDFATTVYMRNVVQ